MQRKKPKLDYEKNPFVRICYDPIKKIYTDHSFSIDTKDILVTKKRGQFIEYVLPVGNEYQLITKYKTSSTLNGRTLVGLNKLRETKQYKFKISDDRVVFDEPIPEFEPLNTTSKEQPSPLSIIAPKKRKTINNTDTITITTDQNKIQKIDNTGRPPKSQSSNRTTISSLQDNPFVALKYNNFNQAYYQNISIAQINNLVVTKMKGEYLEYALIVGNEYQLAGRTQTIKKVAGLNIDELNQSRNGKKQYRFKISGDKVVFDDPIPGFELIDDDLNNKIYQSIGVSAPAPSTTQEGDYSNQAVNNEYLTKLPMSNQQTCN